MTPAVPPAPLDPTTPAPGGDPTRTAPPTPPSLGQRVQELASRTASAVPGVHSLGSPTGRVLVRAMGRVSGGRIVYGPGVSVEVGDTKAAVDVSLTVEFGSPATRVADEVRTTVRDRVRQETGLEVVEVNVTVAGLHHPDDDVAPVVVEQVAEVAAQRSEEVREAGRDAVERVSGAGQDAVAQVSEVSHAAVRDVAEVGHASADRAGEVVEQARTQTAATGARLEAAAADAAADAVDRVEDARDRAEAGITDAAERVEDAAATAASSEPADVESVPGPAPTTVVVVTDGAVVTDDAVVVPVEDEPDSARS